MKCKRKLRGREPRCLFGHTDKAFFCSGHIEDPDIPGDVICACVMGEGCDIEFAMRPDEALEFGECMMASVRGFMQVDPAYRPIMINECNVMGGANGN